MGVETFWGVVLSVVYMAPVAIGVGSVGGQPVFFSISNIILIFSIFFFLRRVSFTNEVFFISLLPVFYIILGGVSSVLYSGSVQVLLSTFSFVLPVLHVFSGMLFARIFSEKEVAYEFFPWAIVLVASALLVSDLVFGSFPRGCGYEGRWGGCLGFVEVYGFPNASMNFLASVSVFLGFLIIKRNRLWVRLLAVFTMAVVGFLSFMSLSRSASLVYLISLFFVLYSLFRFGSIIIFSFVLVGVGLYFEDLLRSLFFSGVYARMEAALESGDITTGRIDIWRHAFDLFSESPFFGKAFYSFSNFSEFGTVHQQYLEVLYKTGIVGFFFYFLLLIVGYLSMRECVIFNRNDHYRFEKLALANGFVVSVLVSSIFQPALSYQVLGSFIFFSCGYFIVRQRLIMSDANEANSSRYG